MADVDLSFLVERPSWEMSMSDEWLGSELVDMLGRPSTPMATTTPAAEKNPRLLMMKRQSSSELVPSRQVYTTGLIEAGIAALGRSEPMDPAQAFALLQCLRFNDPRVMGKLAVRPTASPLIPESAMSYVVCRRLCDARTKVESKEESIPVSFQSILNSEVWWGTDDKFTGEGVASRPMSRCTRSGMRSGSNRHSDSEDSSQDGQRQRKEQTAVHGFRGRMYTLVAKMEQQSSKGRKPKYVAVGDVSLVHTWTATDEDVSLGARSPPRGRSPPPRTPPRNVSPPPGVIAPPTVVAVQSDVFPVTTSAVAEFPGKRGVMPPANNKRGFVDKHSSSGSTSFASTNQVTLRSSSGRSVLAIEDSFDDDAILEAVEEGMSSAVVEEDDDEDEEMGLLSTKKRPRCSGIDPTQASAISINRTLQVRGDVHVSGFIFGQLATTPNNADYAEWFEFQPDLIEYDHHGNVVAVPPPGTVTQLRSPEQRLSLETNGSGPCLIVSTSPSVAAGLPIDARDADKGALVAFLGQVPVRCRGVVHCGDQLVPSGLNDGTAIALRDDDDDEDGKKKRHHLGTDALGIAMEATPSDDDKKDTPKKDEHTILCFVRWNHAVRRELQDEIDKVVNDMHGTFLSALVYSAALVSAGVVALLAALIFFDIVHLAGASDTDGALKRQKARLDNAIFLLTVVDIFLFAGLIIVFTTKLPNIKALILAWIPLGILMAMDPCNRSVRFVHHLLFLAYHALLGHSALLLRKDQTRPNSIFTTLPPRILNLLKLAAPFCCILLIFLLVFIS